MDEDDSNLQFLRQITQDFKLRLRECGEDCSSHESSSLSSSSTSLMFTEENSTLPYYSSPTRTLLCFTQQELRRSREREKHLELELQALQLAYAKLDLERREAHEELMNFKGAIRVFLRVRPAMSTFEELSVVRMLPRNVLQHEPTERKFQFDACLDSDTSQEEVFENVVLPYVKSALDGEHVTILAYGQTGSGKTFTMEGTKTHPGMYARAFQRMFELYKHPLSKFLLSVFQVYNDSLEDLLASPGGPRLEILSSGGVKNLSKLQVSNAQEVEVALSLAHSRRSVGSHALNHLSSRSHLVVTLHLPHESSSMTFVDLAGSERAKNTATLGGRLKEAQHINKSLSALGEVLHSLQHRNNHHHPFRNSKLTFALQECLSRPGGKVAFFACVSPDHANAQETFHTLAFAERIRKVELNAPYTLTQRTTGGRRGGM